jgi:hypothetical protein
MDATDNDDPKKRTQRIYGRGYRDGLQAGVEMNLEKIKRAEDALTGITRKVYEALDDTPATPGTIVQLILRKTGSRADVPVVAGCLHALVEKRLAVEAVTGMFRRVTIKAPTAMSVAISATSIVGVPSVTPQPETITVETASDFDAMRDDIRQFHQHLTEACTVADRLERRVAMIEETQQKFQELRKLLKALG